jgi:hypothetical protein
MARVGLAETLAPQHAPAAYASRTGGAVQRVVLRWRVGSNDTGDGGGTHIGARVTQRLAAKSHGAKTTWSLVKKFGG